MSENTVAMWCLLFGLWQMVTISSGQTCDCKVPNSCDFSQSCFDGGKCNIENVALGRPTNMSSVHPNSAACRAVDGNESNWAESPKGDYTAWWYVDLGRNYTITNITIYRRPGWGGRMADLQVLVGNQLCYTFLSHDYYSTLIGLPLRNDIPCDPPLTGRVVHLQKVNTNRKDDYYTHILSVSEVQVWGCADGYHGANCTQCGHCAGDVPCDVVTGQCPDGCQPGWQGAQCDEKCAACRFGQNCSGQCGRCSENSTCHHVTGECPTGCQAGYQGMFCNKTCDTGRYGVNCSSECGHCADGNTCSTETGQCPAGCSAGWRGQFCNETCDAGTYGANCVSECGQCADNSTCNRVTGECPDGCQNGWQGSLCKEYKMTGEGNNLPIIAGTAGGAAVLLIIVIIVIIFVVRRRRRAPDSKSSENPNDTCTVVTTDPDTEPDFSSGPRSFQPMAIPKAAPEVKKTGPKPADTPKPQLAVAPFVIKTQNKGDNVFGHICMNEPQPQSSSSPPQNGTASENLAHVNISPTNARPHTSAADTASVSSSQSRPTPVPARRNRHRDTTQDSDDTMSVATYDTAFGDFDHIYQNEEDVYAVFKASKPQLDSVQRFLVDRLASGELRQEFKDIPSGQKDSRDVANLPENLKKNRFASIQPYDYNRVKLKDGYDKDGSTDFVNASYISGYESEKAYIAAQGPRDYTTVDFWRMVWQEKITHIVMLTNVVEAGKNKCHEYWPGKKRTKTHGLVQVEGLSEETRASYVIRTFKIKLAGTQDEREIVQYHYVSWPDHDVPTTTSLIMFWRFVTARTARSSTKAPLLVHCSAGVGRSGTFIGLDIGFKMAVKEGKVNVRDLVERMRNERCWMVQAREQYYFLHKALLEAYTARGTFQSAGEFAVTFPDTISVSTGHPRVDTEFKMLTQMRSLAPKQTHEFAENDENIAKNRYPSILPADGNLVHLTESVSGRNQYINAVYMSTFWQECGSILTQLPLPGTLVDFWRMVYGSRVQTIVSLAGKGEGQEVKPYCWYWPRDAKAPVKTGPYTIHLKTQSKIGDRITCYSLKIDKQGASSSHKVRLLRYEDWTDDFPANTSDLLYLLDALDDTGGGDNNAPKIVIQCSDGVSKSGLFSAICHVIHRMRCDREVDVYMTVRHVQSVTPQAVKSEIQYRYLYDLAQRQASEMSVYANA